MYDTVAAVCIPEKPISDDAFTGGMVSESFDKDEVGARLWRNPPDGVYEPRVTYWRHQGRRTGKKLGEHERVSTQEDRGVLKVEFSIAKMAGVTLGNVSEQDKKKALWQVNEFLKAHFGALPTITNWRAQRIDYAWNWPIGALLSAYMVVLHKLQLSTYSRHPYDAVSGVVWKSKGTRGRWVKFYNKTQEVLQRLKRDGYDDAYTPDEQVLRFEVSNYREAVRYMAKEWYCCEQTVGEMLTPGRALYCMGYHWDKLGLGAADSYGHDELLMVRLRERYGTRGFARAHSTLMLVARYGSSVYAEGVELMSRATYHRMRRELLRDGFLTQGSEEEVSVTRVALAPLHLPCGEVFDTVKLRETAESWNGVDGALYIPSKISWEMLGSVLGAGGGQPSDYLLSQAEAYVS